MEKPKLHYCQKCPRKFLSVARLIIHMKYNHKNQEKIKPSNRLRKNNGEQSSTRITFKNSTPAKCEVCNKIYQNKYYLKTHMEVFHEKPKNFKCPICDKCFNHKGSVKYHIDSVHKKLKPYECYICRKSFIVASAVKVHIKTVHEKQRPFKCDICNKEFGLLGNLNSHKNKHHAK